MSRYFAQLRKPDRPGERPLSGLPRDGTAGALQRRGRHHALAREQTSVIMIVGMITDAYVGYDLRKRP